MPDEPEIELKVHEIAACRPVMSEAGKRDLKADIAAHGLLVTIWTFEGEIIGNVDHYQACLELGIRPPLQEWKGEGPLIDVILSLNSHPQYTKGQLAVAAAKIADLGVGRPPGKAQICGISQAEVAKKMGISPRQVQLGAELIRKAERCLVDVVARGEVNLGPALVVADLDASEQVELVSSGPKAIIRKVTEMRREQKALKLDDQGGVVPVAAEAVTSTATAARSSHAEFRLEDYPIRGKLADPFRFDLQVKWCRLANELMAQHGVAPFASDDPWFVVGRYGSDFDPIDDARMTAPPEDWPLCPACKGSGKGRKRSEGCVGCRGKGFLVKRVPLACDRPREDPPGEMTPGGSVPEAGTEPDRTGRGRRRAGRNRLRSLTSNEEAP